MPNVLPATDYIKNVFEYVDGCLYWKRRPRHHFKSDRAQNMWNAKFSTKRAGRISPTSGYRQIMLNHVRYLEHRLIAAMFGLDTSQQIDHINGNRADNRVENLRPCSQLLNSWNSGPRKKSHLRVGVYMVRDGVFSASISRHGRQRHLGTFYSYLDACNARARAEIAEHAEFNYENRKIADGGVSGLPPGCGC